MQTNGTKTREDRTETDTKGRREAFSFVSSASICSHRWCHDWKQDWAFVLCRFPAKKLVHDPKESTNQTRKAMCYFQFWWTLVGEKFVYKNTYIHTHIYVYTGLDKGMRLYICIHIYIISIFLNSWQRVSPVVRREDGGCKLGGKLTKRAYRFRLLQNDKKRIENQTIG